jgi:Tfp pilus assembly ATPase PilU
MVMEDPLEWIFQGTRNCITQGEVAMAISPNDVFLGEVLD